MYTFYHSAAVLLKPLMCMHPGDDLEPQERLILIEERERLVGFAPRTPSRDGIYCIVSIVWYGMVWYGIV